MDNILVPVTVTLLVGIILLFVEYRTSWFANRLSSRVRKQYLEPADLNLLEFDIARVKWIFGTLIVAIPITVVVISLISNTLIAQLEAQVRAYQQSENWELPETLKRLKEVSDEVKLNLDERQKLENLDNQVIELNLAKTQTEGQVNELEGQNTRLLDQVQGLEKTLEELNNQVTELGSEKVQAESQASELEDENSILREQVQILEKALLEPKTIELTEGDTATLVENLYYLGLENIYSTWVSVNLNNESLYPNVGNQLTFKVGNRTCTVTLKNVNYTSSNATFLFFCESG